ncbi:MAG: SH3 domain-containing protein [Thermoanaerobaculia bacterium]|nr:SH3 domain-containing protein [Thermoanaerobaculia bacterium]
MSRRPLSRLPAGPPPSALVATALALSLAAAPAAARTAEIQALVLGSDGSAAELRIEADRALEWRTVRGRGDNLVLELLDALPGGSVGDLATRDGLIREVAVRVVSPGPEPPPATWLTIEPRSPTAHSVVSDGAALVVRFRPARTVSLPSDRYRVSGDPCLNLRREPRLDAPILTCLPRGAMVVAVDSRQGWLRLRLPDGQQGWVAERFLEPLGEGAPTATPAAPAPPEEEAVAALRRERDDLAERLRAAEAETADLRRRLQDAVSRRDELARRLRATVRERDGLARALAVAAGESDRLSERAAGAARAPDGAQEGSGLLVPSEPLQWEPPAEDPVAPEPPRAGPLEPEPPAVAPGPSPSEMVAATVRDWVSAWSERRADDYLAFYAPGFRPADGGPRSAWEAQRRQRLAAPGLLDVRLEGLAVRLLDGESAEATFTQVYRSESLSDTVAKRLRLVRVDGSWRIIEEVVQ